MSAIEQELFYALAQVAIAVTGFAGVVIALVPFDRDSLDPFEQVNMWYVLVHGAAVVFLSFLPTVLQVGGFVEDRIWTAGFAALAFYALVAAAAALVIRSRLRSHRRDALEKWLRTTVGRLIFNVLPFAGLVVAGALALAAADLWIPRNQALYAGFLLLLLAFSLLHFAYFLTTTAAGRSR